VAVLIEWNLEGGGTARVVASDGQRVELQSSRAFPPGATLNGASQAGLPSVSSSEAQSAPAIEAEASPGASPTVTFSVKVRDCAQTSSGGYRITGRFVTLSKPVRLQLLEALKPRGT
jgi:hypothetical protein